MCKCQRLKKYRNAIWDTMEFFDALNLEAVLRDQNSASDKLAVSASTLQPSDEMLKGDCPLEINFRPSIPDNLEHWQVFQDDAQILKFINHLDEFSNYKASEHEEGKEYKDEGNRFNPVTRGFVSLKNIFDRQDRRKNNVE